jgi:DNA-binding CsgD family transcriptional regulator
MVHDDDPVTILLAKKICADCPVVSACFATAERITKTFGRDHASGIWGGLTLGERNSLAGLNRPPEQCPGCGLLCVPVSYATELCQACNPQARIAYDDYRQPVLALIAEGLTYQRIAETLRINVNSLVNACLRWKVKPTHHSQRGKRPTKECGSLAAKTRHQRHGESWENCACRHVPWKKGRSREKDPTTSNTD